MEQRGYEVAVVECSKELSARERIKIKDTTNMVKLDDACEGGEVVITPDFYAMLQVHNEKSDNKDYTVCVVVDKNGTEYVTGSNSFIESFIDIWNEMQGEEEEYSVTAYKRDSNNFKGKQFITCSIN